MKEKIQSGEPLTSDDKIMLILKGQANHFHHLDVDLRQDMIELREDASKEIRELQIDMDKRFETMQEDIKKLYITIKNQTWRMIGAVGAIVVLSNESKIT